jgi:hypothetical protein
MLTRIVKKPSDDTPESPWLDLRRLADVDVTSEDPEWPVAGIFACEASKAWIAGTSGIQVIQVHFYRPLRLTRIHLVCEEHTDTRTQEFVLRWRAADSAQVVDIVRQQFTFAPPGTTQQSEMYRVNLDDVSLLQLTIAPDISGGKAVATIQRFCAS